MNQNFYRVSDPVQARLLSDPQSNLYFYPFWGRDNTIAIAAEVLGKPVNAVHYRVKRFVASGLLEVARVEPRQGRAVKHYRSTADAFFIPGGLGPHLSEEERLLADLATTLEQIAQSMTAGKHHDDTPGRCLYLDADRRIYSSGCHINYLGELSLNTDVSNVSLGAVQHGTLILTDQEACSLRQDLKELVDRYARQEIGQSSPASREYSFVTAIAPTTS